MADSKITALTAISTVDPTADPLVIVDVSDTSMAASGTTKKSTINQLLGSGGTATLASATISGDLTVDTSTLKVDSANNRVGIGTATPGYLLDVQAATAVANILSTTGTNTAYLQISNTGGYFYLGRENSAGTTFAAPAYSAVLYAGGAYPLVTTVNGGERYRIASDGVATWSNVGGVAGTAMTLNSTGLGVGVSPAATIHGYSASGSAQLRMQNGTAVTGRTWYFNSFSDGNLYIGIPTVIDALTVTPSGNVGIGVTPSAWLAAVKALDIGSNAMGIFNGGITHNAYYDSTDGRWEYKGNGAATYWNIQGGLHQWYVAASGIANNPITTFANAAMTLDASGNLLVGLTSPLINTTRRLSVSGTVAAALQSTGAATVETINVWHTATSGNNIFVDFDTEASVTSRGSISYNRAGGLVAYNTTSDYRAKDIIGPVSNSGSLIDSLKVYVGKMKGATIERPMLIAHEAQEVAPYSVTGVKDEVDADGKDKYQQMDVSSFVPLLIAEIQSLRARVQTLEAK